VSQFDQSLLEIVDRYYTDKIRAYGPTPSGVDWNGRDSQRVRFNQLMKLTDERWKGSLNDIGCGYGALFDFLSEGKREADYLGVDISEEMVAMAQKLHRRTEHCRFLLGTHPDRIADYTVASGIFNVRLGIDDVSWRNHINAALDSMRDSSKAGFGFNCLTKYSDSNRRRDHLYYADPSDLFNFCKMRYARNVALLHDYELYEFTILVRL